MRACLRALLVLSLAFLTLGPLGPDAADAEGREGHRWRKRVASAYANLDRARDRHQAALDAYRQMRHRRRVRGERKAAVLAEVDESREGVEAAEQRLEALRKSARRDGVPPGWLRLPARSSPGPASD